MVNFKCQRCGYCCTHLTNVQDGLMFGLYLNEEETKLFDTKDIRPLFKFKDQIIAYQMILNACPHYDDNKCGIYESRPLGCKTFPLKGLKEVETTVCRFTRDHKIEEWNFDVFDKEVEGIKEQIKQAVIEPIPTDMFLFNENKWISWI